jgi:vacuolar-type H+-ATPase subunit I/STV1
MRLMQWQTIPSVVDTQNKTAIEEIRTEIEEIKQRLLVLDERQRKLEEIIEQGKQLKAIKDHDVKFEKFDWKKKFFFRRKLRRIMMNLMACVFVFYVIKK